MLHSLQLEAVHPCNKTHFPEHTNIYLFTLNKAEENFTNHNFKHVSKAQKRNSYKQEQKNISFKDE